MAPRHRRRPAYPASPSHRPFVTSPLAACAVVPWGRHLRWRRSTWQLLTCLGRLRSYPGYTPFDYRGIALHNLNDLRPARTHQLRPRFCLPTRTGLRFTTAVSRQRHSFPRPAPTSSSGWLLSTCCASLEPHAAVFLINERIVVLNKSILDNYFHLIQHKQ